MLNVVTFPFDEMMDVLKTLLKTSPETKIRKGIDWLPVCVAPDCAAVGAVTSRDAVTRCVTEALDSCLVHVPLDVAGDSVATCEIRDCE
jgi:hypothetical protein